MSPLPWLTELTFGRRQRQYKHLSKSFFFDEDISSLADASYIHFTIMLDITELRR